MEDSSPTRLEIDLRPEIAPLEAPDSAFLPDPQFLDFADRTLRPDQLDIHVQGRHHGRAEETRIASLQQGAKIRLARA